MGGGREVWGGLVVGLPWCTSSKVRSLMSSAISAAELSSACSECSGFKMAKRQLHFVAQTS